MATLNEVIETMNDAAGAADRIKRLQDRADTAERIAIEYFKEIERLRAALQDFG